MGKEVYMDDCIKVSQKTKNNELYHYTTANGLKSILDTNEFWVTRSDFLNDRSEIEYTRSIIEKVCRECICDNVVCNKFLEAVEKEIVECNYGIGSGEIEIKGGYYILSFSTEKDSITLWSEYSQFMGYSIGFKQQELIGEIKKYRGQSICWHGNVIYAEDIQIQRIKEALTDRAPYIRGKTYEEIIEKCIKEPQSQDAMEDFKNLVMDFSVITSVYAMFFKQPCFKEENEYRIVFSAFHEGAGAGLEKKMNFREKEGFLIPYIVTKVKERNELLPVMNITVAPKNTVDLAVRGMEYFLKAKGYDVPIIKSQIPLRY